MFCMGENKQNSKKSKAKKIIRGLDIFFVNYYILIIPILLLLPIIILIAQLEEINIQNPLTDHTFKIGIYLALVGFIVALSSAIQFGERLRKAESEIKTLKNIVQSIPSLTKNNESVLNDEGKQKTAKIHKHHIHLVLAIILMIFGLTIYAITTWNDRPEVDRWGGFDIVRQENVTLSSLSFDIVTLGETQRLHIFYATNEIHGKSPFLMIMIPYLVTLVNPDGDGYSIPEKWQTYQDPGLKTTIVYKFFDCTEREYCADQLNMYFDFEEKIDSKQYYIHSTNIPFKSPTPREVIDVRNEILKDIPSNYWKSTWGLENRPNPVLTVSVIDDSTQYNPIPAGYLKLNSDNRTGITNSVMVWNVPEHAIDFHLDYVNPSEREWFDNLRTFAIVLFGASAAFLAIYISEYFSRKYS